jgi:single-strand DNA-binding protein
MNSVNIIGRLTKDPELKYTTEGKAVCSCCIAVDGYKKDDVDFIPIKAWAKQAEFMANYLKKGSKVGITGRISVRPYEKDGKKLTFTEVIVENVQGLDSKPKEEDVPQQPTPMSKPMVESNCPF